MRLPPLLRAAFAALFALVLLPSRAQAHGHLLRSSPAAGAMLHELPRMLRLEFNEAPELAVSSVRLLDARRREVALSPLRTAGDSLRVVLADVAGELSPGRYTVAWQVAGRDGHPVRGEYRFTIAADAAGPVALPAPTAPLVQVAPAPAPEPGIATETHRPGEFDSGSPAYALVRWAQFVGLLIVIGAVAFHSFVLGALRRREAASPVLDLAAGRARYLALLGALLLAVSALARLFAQWTAMRLDAVAPSAVPLERVVMGTTWGHAWILQVVALAVLTVGLLLARRPARSGTGWSVATLSAAVLAVTPALSGHAAVPGTALAIALDALHVLAAGGWIGGLFMLLAAGMPAARALPQPARGALTAALVNAFSPTALAFATVVAFTGVVASWRNVESLSALATSSYGRVLLLKLSALGVAALIGLYNWRRARPALAATGDDAAIRRAMRAELAAGVVVLLLTAILVAIPTPADLTR